MTTLGIPKGITWAMEWPVTDENNQPADVSDWDLWGQVRPTASSAVVLHEWSKDIGNVELGNGYVRILVHHTESAAWTWAKGKYDLLLIAPDDASREPIDSGEVRVRITVTRAPKAAPGGQD